VNGVPSPKLTVETHQLVNLPDHRIVSVHQRQTSLPRETSLSLKSRSGNKTNTLWATSEVLPSFHSWTTVTFSSKDQVVSQVLRQSKHWVAIIVCAAIRQSTRKLLTWDRCWRVQMMDTASHLSNKTTRPSLSLDSLQRWQASSQTMQQSHHTRAFLSKQACLQSLRYH